MAPTTLLVTLRRYRCIGCGQVWRQDTSKAAQPRAMLSRHGLRWALEGLVCQHLTVARIAGGLQVSWNTANTAVLAEGRRVLIDDLTTIRDGTGPSRLLDMVEGRSKQAFKQWLAEHDPLFTSRQTLHTGTDLLTDKQRQRLQALFGSDRHVEC